MGQLMVREFAREDERRVMLVLDPFIGLPRVELGDMAAAEHAEQFERAISMTACIAWHFNGDKFRDADFARIVFHSAVMPPASRNYLRHAARTRRCLNPTRRRAAARSWTTWPASTRFSRLSSRRAHRKRFRRRYGRRLISFSLTGFEASELFRYDTPPLLATSPSATLE